MLGGENAYVLILGLLFVLGFAKLEVESFLSGINACKQKEFLCPKN